jgi:hypothetical protein
MSLQNWLNHFFIRIYMNSKSLLSLLIFIFTYYTHGDYNSSVGGHNIFSLDFVKLDQPYCRDGDAELLSKNFVAHNFDQSSCPHEDWYTDMSLYHFNYEKEKSELVFVNVGVNKGYNFGIMMLLFAPWLNIDLDEWAKVYQKMGLSAFEACGNCGDCKFKYRAPNYAANLNYASNHKLILIGIDLNIQNVDGTKRVIQSIRNRLYNVDTYLFHAAGGSVVKQITIPKCGGHIGDEKCSVEATDVTTQQTFTVPMVTVDKISRDFCKRHKNCMKQRGNGAGDHAVYQDIDILIIDTEGHDPNVLEGASELLRLRKIRCVIFEYHSLDLWQSTNLHDVISEMHDNYDMDCFFQGKSRLWPLNQGSVTDNH